MRLDAATLHPWLAEHDCIRRATELAWVQVRRYIQSEPFQRGHGSFDETLVTIEPTRLTLWFLNWPACDQIQVSLLLTVWYRGSYAAGYHAEFGWNGKITSGALETWRDGIRTDWVSPLTPEDRPDGPAPDCTELRRWMEAHDAEQRTIKGFWTTLRNYRNEDPAECREVFGEAEDAGFTAAVTAASLMVDFVRYGPANAVIGVRIPVIYKGVRVGNYDAEYDLAGECMDDWFF